MRTSRTAALRARLNAIADELARLESRPEEPPVGSVIRFNMKFSGYGTVYQYAAIHAGDDKWYTTGPRSPKGYTWEMLLDWMESGTDGFLVLKEELETFTEISDDDTPTFLDETFRQVP